MKVLRTILLKDLRLLWPLAALTFTLILLPALVDFSGASIGFYLPLAGILSSAIFMLCLIQLDPPASLRHDWLTRPIPRRALICAKLLLFAAVVLLPAGISAAVTAEREGANFGEIAISFVNGGKLLLFIGFAVFIAATISAGIIEALGVLIGTFLVFSVVGEVGQQFSGLPEALMSQGSWWVLTDAIVIVFAVGGLAALWMQWRRRSTKGARIALGTMLVGCAVIWTVTDEDVLFAGQQAFSSAPPEETRFAIARAPGCLDANWIGGLTSIETIDGPWTREQLTRAGTAPLAFRTAVRSEGLPSGWRMFVSQVRARLDASRTLYPVRLEPSWQLAIDGTLEVRHIWLMPRDWFTELRRNEKPLQLTYRTALLAPVHTAAIAANGKRHRVIGAGICTAEPKAGGAVEVKCFKIGSQPDLLVVRPVGGRANLEVQAGPASFEPASLGGSSGQTYFAVVRTSDSKVEVTTYEARGHVERRISVPNVLGSPKCTPKNAS